MIGFTAPWALLGLAAAAIPVLLHLFARREPPTVLFPATRYLAETARAHHRRLTLQHWLLLLIRTLLIVALALAAAGPTWPSGGLGSHAPAALTLVVDNSLSSGVTAGGTPAFEQLRTIARDVLAAARSDDALWLIAADGQPQRGSRDELAGMVDRLVPVPSRLDLGRAVNTARDAMAGEKIPSGVLVLSDLQATAVSGLVGRGPVIVVRPAGPPTENLGIVGISAGRQPWGPEGGDVAVLVQGTAGRSAALKVQVGTRPPRQQLVRAGASVDLASGRIPPGWWPVRAELEPDELRLDDVRETAVRVAAPSRATWNSGDRFLATACDVLLQNERLVRGNDLTIGALGAGSSIVAPPADPASVGAVNRALASRGAAWRFGEIAPGSGVTDSGPLLGRHQVQKRYQLIFTGRSGGAAPGLASRGVLIAVGGAPWVVRDRGILLLGSRLEPSWTDLPLSAEFVPFIDFLANRAVRGELALLDVAPGDPALLPDAATAVVLDGHRRPVEGGSTFRSAERGLHFILAESDTIGVVAVNPDPRESVLERESDAGLRALWPGARVVPPSAAAAAAFSAGGRADLRGPLLLLAVVLALADALLAGLGARRVARTAA